jgi:hypothetical protein
LSKATAIILGGFVTVKDIIKDAMRLVGRADAAETAYSDGEDEEIKRLEHTMLFCLNAVSDELARGYFPAQKEETFNTKDGVISFDSFSKKPIKILKVKRGERKIGWRILPEYLQTDVGEIKILYEYVPDKFALEDEFSYPDNEVGERLVEFGMAAEYQLICGEVESANCWEDRYRAEIDRLLSCHTVRERIPPRRWL